MAAGLTLLFDCALWYACMRFMSGARRGFNSDDKSCSLEVWFAREASRSTIAGSPPPRGLLR